MAELERKLMREVRTEDARIIVCRFQLPNCQPAATIGGGVDTVWVYNLNDQPQFKGTLTAPTEIS